MRALSDIQLLLSNAVRPADRGEERHCVRWFIDNGIRAEFDCLHPPVPAPAVCDAVNFEAGGADELVEFYEGSETPLRGGIIKSWWTQPGVSATYSWVYGEAPAARAAVPEAGPQEAAEPTPASPGLFGSLNRTRPSQRHDVHWYICEGVAQARLTCLHEAAEHCDKTEFEEDGLLPFTHKGGRTVLRDGIIESWWSGDDWDGYDIHWDYADTPSGDRS